MKKVTLVPQVTQAHRVLWDRKDRAVTLDRVVLTEKLVRADVTICQDRTKVVFNDSWNVKKIECSCN